MTSSNSTRDKASTIAVPEGTLTEYLRIAREAAVVAAEIALSMQDDVKSEMKSGKTLASSIVTEADRKTEHALIEFLSDRVPEHAIVGEETGRHGEFDWCWYLDPIDGTGNYARGSEIWGINIGLSFKGRPVVGVIAYPRLGYTLHGAEGIGAWRGEKRLRVEPTVLARAIYGEGGVRKDGLKLRRKLTLHVGDVRIFGAGSVTFGQLAQGNIDIITGGPSDHDICAGCVLVREAGGRVTQFDGKEWHIGSQSLAATNGALHEEVLEILKDDTYF